ncbi:MAG TPA: DUF4070 domain-containing protein [Methylomirabilota bacterium]|nr:DUF4070 domain-containing protein [Methylomirabilota bacterium]
MRCSASASARSCRRRGSSSSPEREGRLVPDGGRESNVRFKVPYEAVLAMWRKCITAAYEPAALYDRYAYNVAHTFANRLDFPQSPRRASWGNFADGLGILARILWRIGARGDYRDAFWRLAWPALRAGKIEALINVAVVSHHLIEFTRDCLRGAGEASFYAPAERV